MASAAGMSRVTFEVSCQTRPSERVVLSGEETLLGGWDALRGVEMSSHPPGAERWHVTVELPTGRQYHYRYSIVSEEPGIAVWTPQRDLEVKRSESFERVLSLNYSQPIVVDDGEFDRRRTDEDDSLRIRVRRSSVDHDPAKTLLIVLYRLPIIATRDASNKSWSFRWDDDALYLTSVGIRQGLKDLRLKWIGVLNTEDDVPEDEREDVCAQLHKQFNCFPVFIPTHTHKLFYEDFCKGVLWPVFHSVTRVTDADEHTVEFEDAPWDAYREVNRLYSEVVLRFFDDGNMIWIHDYHLMLLPAHLRMKLSGANIGFFLHVPWPSSESFRLLPRREELLVGLLSASLLGFNLFDYARHFLSACVRILNIEHEGSRGSLAVEYRGRHVMIRVSHIGIHPPRFIDALNTAEVGRHVAELRALHGGRFVLGGVDDLDFVKGIALKLMAFEALLQTCAYYRGRVVLHQVAIPRKRSTPMAERTRRQVRELVERINREYGGDAVTYIERPISLPERIALYRATDALFLTPIRDGLNLIPYEYVISTQNEPKRALILSEFIGCSRALSSATRLNPWNITKVARTIDQVIQTMQRDPRQAAVRHRADLLYVMNHTTTQWAESFLRDLARASEPIQEVTYLGMWFRLDKRLMAFEGFHLLNTSEVVHAYRQSKRRLLLLDYDGTLTSTTCSSRMEHAWARPMERVQSLLERLAADPQNTVYIMSGRTRQTLQANVKDVRALGVAAEHGYYYRLAHDTQWRQHEGHATRDRGWVRRAYEVMKAYTDRTDGSYIEEKTTGLVWHYLDADPEFGNMQAKEMELQLLEDLDTEVVEVVQGISWLQVRFKNINKGTMVQRVLRSERFLQLPDFVLCVGDDKTDEDMFSCLEEKFKDEHSAVYTCTVGVKPSRAHFYLRHSDEVVDLLEKMPGNELRSSLSSPEDLQVQPLVASHG